MRYFIEIDYDEPNVENYKSVILSECFSDTKFYFNSGDFIKDWFNMIKYMIMESPDDRFSASFSSSVDHFIMDGAPYDSMYLHFTDGAVLNNDDIGIEIFVKENETPTWEELKEYCK